MIRAQLSDEIRKILSTARTIAVVGISPKPERPSHQVAKYLLAAGYRVLPVNPGQREILGLPCYPDLPSVPERIDIVDIFRRPDQVEPIVRGAVACGAQLIWMQEGIVNERAAAYAEENGIAVVMDRCLMVDHRNLFGSGGSSL
ncbi:MAG: CoA-binding protein [Desulfobulbaceae bacterium]